MEPDFYEILGLRRDASDEVIRLAAQRTIGASAPDARWESAEFRVLAATAWYVLGDPARRADYDGSTAHEISAERARAAADFLQVEVRTADQDRLALRLLFDRFERAMVAVAKTHRLDIDVTDVGSIDYETTFRGFVETAAARAEQRASASTVAVADLETNVAAPLNRRPFDGGARRSRTPGSDDVVVPASTWEEIETFFLSHGMRLTV